MAINDGYAEAGHHVEVRLSGEQGVIVTGQGGRWADLNDGRAAFSAVQVYFAETGEVKVYNLAKLRNLTLESSN